MLVEAEALNDDDQNVPAFVLQISHTDTDRYIRTRPVDLRGHDTSSSNSMSAAYLACLFRMLARWESYKFPRDSSFDPLRIQADQGGHGIPISLGFDEEDCEL